MLQVLFSISRYLMLYRKDMFTQTELEISFLFLSIVIPRSLP